MPIVDTVIGEGTKIWHPELVNLYGCTIGENCNIASFVEIGPEVVVGDRCRIQSFSFIPKGVILGNDVFIGPNVTFTNDKHPRNLFQLCVFNLCRYLFARSIQLYSYVVLL